MSTAKTRTVMILSYIVAIVATSILLIAGVAYGQASSQPASAGDPWFVFTSMWTALQHRSWGLGMAAALVLIVLGLRYGAGLLAARLPGRAGKACGWLNTDRGGALLVLASGVAGAVFVAKLAGQALTPQVLTGGIGAGITAAGGWNVVKRLLAPKDGGAAPVSPTNEGKK